MLDDRLRPWKDRALAPLVRWAGGRVLPVVITGIALLVGLSCALAAWRGMPWLAVGLWIANRILDGLDGAVARAQGRDDDLGGYLDIALDFVVYAAVPIGALGGQTDPWALRALVALLASFYVNAGAWMALAAILEKRRQGTPADRRTAFVMPPGIVGGTETIVLYIALLGWPDVAHVVAWLMAALVLASAVQRILWALRYLR